LSAALSFLRPLKLSSPLFLLRHLFYVFKALRLENPKLKKSVQQIQEAVTFAEAKLNAEMRKRNARS